MTLQDRVYVPAQTLLKSAKMMTFWNKHEWKIFLWNVSWFVSFEEFSWKLKFNMNGVALHVKHESHRLQLELLPNEILYLILKHLSPIDLITCYNTSKEMRNVITSMKELQNKCKLFFWQFWFDEKLIQSLFCIENFSM